MPWAPVGTSWRAVSVDVAELHFLLLPPPSRPTPCWDEDGSVGIFGLVPCLWPNKPFVTLEPVSAMMERTNRGGPTRMRLVKASDGVHCMGELIVATAPCTLCTLLQLVAPDTLAAFLSSFQPSICRCTLYPQILYPPVWFSMIPSPCAYYYYFFVTSLEGLKLSMSSPCLDAKDPR